VFGHSDEILSLVFDIFLEINVNHFNMHLSFIHVLKVFTNRGLESTACGKKIKATDRCIVTIDSGEIYITFAVALFFIILKRAIECQQYISTGIFPTSVAIHSIFI